MQPTKNPSCIFVGMYIYYVFPFSCLAWYDNIPRVFDRAPHRPKVKAFMHASAISLSTRRLKIAQKSTMTYLSAQLLAVHQITEELPASWCLEEPNTKLPAGKRQPIAHQEAQERSNPRRCSHFDIKHAIYFCTSSFLLAAKYNGLSWPIALPSHKQTRHIQNIETPSVEPFILKKKTNLSSDEVKRARRRHRPCNALDTTPR